MRKRSPLKLAPGRKRFTCEYINIVKSQEQEMENSKSSVNWGQEWKFRN